METEMVVIEVMPTCHLASHRAANNFGVYPANGAERYVTTRSWAREVTADSDYDHIVRAATDADIAELDELPESW